MATEQPDTEILINRPPIIIGATENVIPDPREPVVGVPLALFRMVFNQQQGVLANAVSVLVDPPPREGTGSDPISIALWLNDSLLEERQIQDADRDRRTSFDLFESSLVDGINNKLEYKVRRPSGNVGDSTPLWVLYSEQLPGGNIVPGGGDHPYLDISLPPELGDPPVIGKEDVDRGVPLTLFYPYMKAYDVITVELRRERFTFTVQPGQVGQPLVITLTRAMFEQAGNAPDFAISYTVIDQLLNPTEKRRWSIMLIADVDVDRVVLDAPILREDLTDPADDPATVDRDKLNGAPLLVVVLPVAPQFEVGDQVEGRYTGMPSGVDVSFTGIIDKDVFGRFNPCIMEIPNAQVVVNDQVRATYTLLRAGNSVGISKPAMARVIGAGTITLNPPTLVPPATNPINVLEYDAGVTVRVTFAGNPGDQAQLKELNPPVGAQPFPRQDIIGGQSDFTLSQAFLAARQNSVIELTWELFRGGVSAGESTPLRLTINRMIDHDPRLPTPTIPHATDGITLDLTSFAGDSRFDVVAWRGIAVGQKLWASCEGQNASGTTVTHTIYSGVDVPSTGNQWGPIPRAFLEQLADGSQIKVLISVNFKGEMDEVAAVKFPFRAYTVRASFKMDTSLMTLSGLNINSDRLALTGNDVPGTVQTRVPSSGDGAYSYLSSNPNVATVSTTGKVTSVNNGMATITVTEISSQRQVSYNVLVTNVMRLVMTSTFNYSITAAINWMNSVSGSPVSNAAIDVLKVKYRPLVSSAGGWLCRSDGCNPGTYLCVRTDSPNSWAIVCFTGNNSQAHGWCLVN
ncbi:Ig-like domain-containing protein [Pseudomonas sp. dw_612]|uniref:Ig-like domain-containing protein n=1 Tax=Pseudomonas sp. dw_612 TaxID=2720080 RepID=UPI001BD2E800|nr:Ig-like domain-containing protein [Pseudomonas sp. dw_612]